MPQINPRASEHEYEMSLDLRYLHLKSIVDLVEKVAYSLEVQAI